MDGFHFAHEVVEANGWLERKGAPHTFDAAGFVSLLRRLASLTRGQTAYAPRYDRALRQPIGSAVRVAHDDRLVIVEGNYLLLEDRPWLEVRSTLDTCVYLEMDDTRRVDGLVERHIRFGKDPATARRFVMKSDEANALVVAATRNRADLIVEV